MAPFQYRSGSVIGTQKLADYHILMALLLCTLFVNLCRVYLRVDRRRLRFLILDDPLFHMVALTPLSLSLQVTISAMSLIKVPDFCFYIIFFAEKIQTSKVRQK